MRPIAAPQRFEIKRAGRALLRLPVGESGAPVSELLSLVFATPVQVSPLLTTDKPGASARLLSARPLNKSMPKAPMKSTIFAFALFAPLCGCAVPDARSGFASPASSLQAPPLVLPVKFRTLDRTIERPIEPPGLEPLVVTRIET